MYRPGDNYVICDRTGFKVHASQARKEWNGLIVRRESWEPRHPQDIIRGRKDDQSVRDPRPDSTPLFVGANEVTADDLTANPTADPFPGVVTIWDNGGTIWDSGGTVWD